jgi:PAS domain S-box-containing protein
LVIDTEMDERWVYLTDDPDTTRSALSVPLLCRDQLNGILTLTHSRSNFFDHDDLNVVVSIAGQAAVAIENARLFDRVRHERATLHTVINSVTEGILITDVDGQVLYVNPAGAEALGVSAAAARGQSLGDVVPDHRLLDLLQALLSSGESQRDEIYGSDGKIFDASLVLVPGTGAVTTLHDVTQFKEVDALKSEFVDTVSHDLKAPLGLLYGYAWLLADSPGLGDEAHHYANIIINGIQRMQKIITSLLDLTMIEGGVDQVIEPVDLSALVHESFDAFEAKIKEKGLQVTLDADPDLPQVQGHPIRLGQAVTNLISNAVKYTASGGCIDVSINVEGDEILVRVSDTGPGIPEEKQTRLFNKFYKVGTRETLPQEGHGLGLAIVKSVAEAHGGRAAVESVIGQGTTFIIALPFTP